MKLQRGKKQKINGEEWFFEKINKNDRLLARLNKDKGQKTQIANIGNKRRDFPRDPLDIDRIRRNMNKILPIH